MGSAKSGVFQGIPDDTLRDIEKKLQNATNKNKAWEEIVEQYGFNVSWTAAKPYLEAAGVKISKSLPYNSVSEYKDFWKRYLSDPTASKEGFASKSFCPPPTEGIYVDIQGFNNKAQYDRTTLLQKANLVAKESYRCLPAVYRHGFAMGWNELETLMIANGFELHSKTEAYTDDTGKTRQNTYEYFSDIRPDILSSAPDKEKMVIDLDDKREEKDRKHWTYSKDTVECVEQVMEDAFKDNKRTKARESKIINAAMMLGAKEILRRRSEKTLSYKCQQAKKIIQDIEW